VDSATVEHLSENPTDYPTDRLASQISTQNQLKTALAKLPPIHQAVLLMHAREGYKYDEIAKRLKVSVYQVERYLASAKQAMMEIDWEWD
jgi:RNA polymerase sigma factor (sigma-70 family)